MNSEGWLHLPLILRQAHIACFRRVLTAGSKQASQVCAHAWTFVS